MDPINSLQGQYNLWIVLLSFVIAVVASYLALNLNAKLSQVRGRHRFAWLAAGSWVMGCGIWSMHFVGMLAYELPVPMEYDITITFLSLLAAVASSYIAFSITMPEKVGWVRFGAGGFFMGAGITAMHYTGMAAMRVHADVHYIPSLWALSAGIALAASYAALFLFIRFRHKPSASWWKGGSAVIMGLAICGMHYTGMRAAMYHSMGPIAHQAGMDMSGKLFLLAAVTVATFLILAVSWGAMYFDRHVLEKMAFQDALTGLPNRHDLIRYFDRLELTGGKEAAVLFLDLDRFKTINDTLGHDVGDLLIQEVALRVSAAAGKANTVFRLGGDEFLIAAPSAGLVQAEELAQSLLAVIKQPYRLGGHELYVTGSIGISLAPEHGSTRAALMKTADTAMYQAKTSGKNRHRVFNEEMDRRLVRKLGLEKDMRRALVRGEFFVLYQPKWDARHQQPAGVEALVRWKHPDIGTISPAEFIPIAEETGLIVPLTRWVLQEACLQNRRWQEEGLPSQKVAVNLSIRVFESQNLGEMVGEALQLSSLAPEYLELEITESLLLYDIEDIVRQLEELRGLGVTVAMDDFGSGYSALGSLDKMPIDTLKIDQLFIRESNLESKQAIILAIIMMARQLNLRLVAEGVETEAQMAFLRSSGCDVMQGYYYGKPMTEQEIQSWMERSLPA
ncbi:EAL domain-containing protein [Paenibacillus aurantius]|uniref:EAL domain-containing protein n=1 Tax=Paenibacillus aurantius TaxID=2918900 RepID=A0AA96RHP8_9BACL|nr:EAL domain-containing protein [Paenibacillus aurantius]WNQ11354.1 EAL domain-containing protein [Paenibacillus aurantius]